MGWEDFAMARQLLGEETAGHNVREARAREDAEFREAHRLSRG